MTKTHSTAREPTLTPVEDTYTVRTRNLRRITDYDLEVHFYCLLAIPLTIIKENKVIFDTYVSKKVQPLETYELSQKRPVSSIGTYKRLFMTRTICNTIIVTVVICCCRCVAAWPRCGCRR